MKLSTAITHFDTQLRADGKSERTRQAYLGDLAKLRCWLDADISIASITPNMLARFLADGNGEPLSPLTVNRTKTALRVFFRFLRDAGYVGETPARLIRSTPADRKVPNYLSTDEARRLFTTTASADTTVATRDHAMFSLLLGTGIRLGSLVGLNADDVNLAEQTINIKAKGGRQQTVFLTAQLCRVLKLHIKAQATGDGRPLFGSRSDGRLGPRQVQLRLQHWLEVAGITKRLSVHSLRHYAEFRIMRSSIIYC